MTVLWFSPVDRQRNEIANYSANVVSCLSRFVDVEVVSFRSAQQGVGHLGGVPVRGVNTLHELDLLMNDADAVFFNIGNSAEHLGIWMASQRYPGMVVLHDERLLHLFGVLDGSRPEYPRFEDLMLRHYGARGRDALVATLRSGRFDPAELAQEFPLTEAAVSHASAILVHSETTASAVRRISDVPVVTAGLPHMPRSRMHSERHTPSDQRCLRLMIFGHLGSNRCIAEVVDAVAKTEERERLRLDIYGNQQSLGHLTSQIAQLGLEHLIHFHGFVEDAELSDALDNADLVVNLRRPTMGEVSASQLRAWDHGRATVVTDHGWYSSIPHAAAFRVPPGEETAGLVALFARLLRDPGELAAVGQAGHARLVSHHDIDFYVTVLLDLVANASQYAARSAGRALAARTDVARFTLNRSAVPPSASVAQAFQAVAGMPYPSTTVSSTLEQQTCRGASGRHGYRTGAPLVRRAARLLRQRVLRDSADGASSPSGH